LCGPAAAALIVVDEAACRLPDAVVAANTDTVQGGCTAGSGEDFLLLDSDVTLGDTRYRVEVSSAMTIQAGNGTTIDGAGGECFFVEETGKLAIAGVTIQNCYANQYGGGIYNRGTLTLDRATIQGCSAYLAGGGLWSRRATVTIVDSTFLDNTALSGDYAASGGGGGVGSVAGVLTIVGSTIAGNVSYDEGGGVYSGADLLTIVRSTISGNDPEGVFAWGGGNARIVNSTISGNHSHGMESGSGNELTIRNSSITGNAEIGVYHYGQHVKIERSLIAGNAGSVYVPTSVTVRESFNLFGTDGNAGVEGFTPAPSDVIPAAGVMLDDILLPLADNGGPTQTHALVPGGPAVDAIPTSEKGCLGTVDQRGVPRPQGPGCDIGAFELEASVEARHVLGTIP
jgi:hypothetical protein